MSLFKSKGYLLDESPNKMLAMLMIETVAVCKARAVISRLSAPLTIIENRNSMFLTTPFGKVCI